MNADTLKSRMHKADPKLALDKQDKRSVIPLDPSNFDHWLEGTVGLERVLMRLAPTEVFAVQMGWRRRKLSDTGRPCPLAGSA